MRKTGFTSCSVSGCARKHYCSHLCCGHYRRKLKYGSPTAPKPKAWDRSGSKNPRWKGGEIKDGHGRIVVYSPGHPFPSWNKTHVYRYRLVVEKHIGRYLLPVEIVHHKNGIPNDDRIENLEITTRQDHIKKHQIKGKLCSRPSM